MDQGDFLSEGRLPCFFVCLDLCYVLISVEPLKKQKNVLSKNSLVLKVLFEPEQIRGILNTVKMLNANLIPLVKNTINASIAHSWNRQTVRMQTSCHTDVVTLHVSRS